MGTTNLIAESDIMIKEVKDSDLVVSQNNQALITSLKVSEYFGKQHKHVLDSVEKAVDNLSKVNGPNFRSVENGFVETTYTDSKGEKRRMYYLNRDAFTFNRFSSASQTCFKVRSPLFLFYHRLSV